MVINTSSRKSLKNIYQNENPTTRNREDNKCNKSHQEIQNNDINPNSPLQLRKHRSFNQDNENKILALLENKKPE